MILVLLAANVGVFVWMAVRTGSLSWDAETLFDWGGNFGALSLHGQPWRLLTSMFLHANLGHIFGNMVLLLITGAFLQRKLGSLPFLLVYLLCGLAGSIVSAEAHPQVVGIGASGAIAGLLGCMTVLKLAGRAAEVSTGWMVQVIGLNALYSFAPSVDGFAHAGGFVAGMAAGALAAWRFPQTEPG